MMWLSRVVPARRKTVRFQWCARDFLTVTPQFRQIRSGSRNPMDKCWWCGHVFADGEKLSLACPEGKGGNKALCASCADECLASEKSLTPDAGSG